MALLPVLILLPMAMALVAVVAGRESHALRDSLVSLTGAVVFGLFLLFYPVLAGQAVDAAFITEKLRWLDSWVLTLE